MDHLDEPHKPNDPEKNRRVIRNDDQDQSGYYYDDATNYEIYRDDTDESDEDDTDS
jgi:hypothetical protein